MINDRNFVSYFDNMIIVKILLSIYYICFVWLILLIVISFIILVVAGIHPLITWTEVYMYRWYNYAAFAYLSIRFIGSLFVSAKIKSLGSH
ncbi:MAG TPA: hypothetical protein VF622_00885 [Segetibacter sp.]